MTPDRSESTMTLTINYWAIGQFYSEASSKRATQTEEEEDPKIHNNVYCVTGSLGLDLKTVYPHCYNIIDN